MIYALTILLFLASGEPVILAKPFGSLAECQVAEGQTLTAVYTDDKVTGFLVIDECKALGGKATKS